MVPFLLASPPQPEPPAAAEHVQGARATRAAVWLIGSDPAAARLALALNDAFQRLCLGLRLEQVPAKSRPAPDDLPLNTSSDAQTALRLWIDLSRSGGVTLYVSDDVAQRIFVRRFETPRGLDELVIEQITLVASSSIEAVVAGERIGIERRHYAPERELPPSPPAPAAGERTRSSRPAVWGALSGGYAVSWLGAGTLSHGPVLSLKLQRSFWGVGVATQARLPTFAGTADSALQVRLTSMGFRYRVWHVRSLSEAWRIAPGLGIGADFTQVNPRTSSSVVAASAPFWVGDAVAQAYAALVHVARGWALGGALGIDVARPASYVVEQSAERDLLFRPFVARPFIELELSASVLP